MLSVSHIPSFAGISTSELVDLHVPSVLSPNNNCDTSHQPSFPGMISEAVEQKFGLKLNPSPESPVSGGERSSYKVWDSSSLVFSAFSFHRIFQLQSRVDLFQFQRYHLNLRQSNVLDIPEQSRVDLFDLYFNLIS